MDGGEAEALFADGVGRMAAGAASDAEAAFRRALLAAPELVEAWVNLGLLRQRAGDATQAEACFRQAIARDARCLQAYLNLSVLLLEHKRLADAEALAQQGLRIAPGAALAWSNYGVVLACAKRDAEAEQCYRTALGIDPGYRTARFNLAYVLLRQGRLAEGWEALEARDWYASFERFFACARWRGEPLHGKALVVACEAGHGDMIQFCRYVPLLKMRGAASVSLICHPGLRRLMQTLPGVDRVFAIDAEIPADAWDYWAPALSLPGYCGTTLDAVPAAIPYLHAEAARVDYWRSRLPEDGRRVGLVWKGNPRFENDAERSLPSLAALAPLQRVAGVRFVSLQKGAGEDEAERSDVPVVLPLGRELDDFADTAALVAALDLVIAVDTAVAHLAGALGKPCWVLLPDYKADWRWLTGRGDSPWYPSLRLFRQDAGGGWAPIVARVADALLAWRDGQEVSAATGEARR